MVGILLEISVESLLEAAVTRDLPCGCFWVASVLGIGNEHTVLCICVTALGCITLGGSLRHHYSESSFLDQVLPSSRTLVLRVWALYQQHPCLVRRANLRAPPQTLLNQTLWGGVQHPGV